MPKFNAYLNFNGQAREAMALYAECFGGKPHFTLVGNSPFAAEMPDDADVIMHSQLIGGDIVLMATDMTSSEPIVRGNNVTLSLACDSDEQIKRYFAKLSDGGQVICELEDAFWGDTFGLVVDRFGIRWMLTHPTNS